MRVTDAMKSLIVANATHEQLKEEAARDGMSTLHEQALRLVAKDVTTLAEVARTVYVL
jgi:type II secretory ATPase GspE/PulE/Tfp pilus assembly ATPase PilB-like protein